MQEVRIGNLTYFIRHVDSTVWEESTLTGPHSTITFDCYGRCLGKVGTNPDPSSYSHLPPGSPERISAVQAEYARLHKLCDLVLALAT